MLSKNWTLPKENGEWRGVGGGGGGGERGSFQKKIKKKKLKNLKKKTFEIFCYCL